MKNALFGILGICLFTTIGCSDKEEVIDNTVEAPAEYLFVRDGANSVSFSGQTTRILMAGEFSSALSDFNRTEMELLEMYANQSMTGGDVNPFENSNLNASTKSISSKVASSRDLFNANTVETAEIKNQMQQWIASQVNEIGANQGQVATAGTAGQIADGSKTRYISAQGLEYNQLISKSLIGGLMVDQILNNYLSPAVLDQGDSRDENDRGITEEAQSYTSMEHKWDEAYGYLFGATENLADPLSTLGSDDSFLNKYLGRVEGDSDFSGIASDIYDAYKLGRAAIVAKNYEVRDEQANVIRDLISKVIGVRAVYYLQQGKFMLTNNTGGAFHALSEGYGFIYSLRFTRAANSTQSIFSRDEVDAYLTTLLSDGDNGLWDVSPQTLDQISNDIATKFDFSVEQAAE